MAKLILNMIVKDEAHIIGETLENLVATVPFDYWVISDTGSTDETPKIIVDFFKEKGIEGELFQDEWVNFAHNRNKALEHARGKGDYIFVFDADDRMEGQLNLPENLTADAYYLTFSSGAGAVAYRRIALFKNSPDIFWRGVVHEFIHTPDSASITNIFGDYRILSRRLGSRSLDKDKYLKDAQLLEKAILDKQDEDLLPRYTFYCARSYRDAGRIDEAIAWFERRAMMTQGWNEEAYCAALDAGNFYEVKQNIDMAYKWWEKATTINPNRAEAWQKLARSHRQRGAYHLAFAYAYMAKDLVANSANLFIWQSSYDYEIASELLAAGVEIKRFDMAYEGYKKLVLGNYKDLYTPYNRYLTNFAPFFDLDVVTKLGEK